MKKICVVTATRAEYGLLKPLMLALKNDNQFSLQVLVTGAHLSPEFGYTYKQIEDDGFTIDQKIEMLLSADTSTSIVKTMGLGMIGFADALEKLNPDALVVLGDRYEMLAIAASATVMKIPIIHLYGGDITEGAYDDAFRHAITKLSNLHFTSTEEYRKRVIQMGENPINVFNVGAIGIDNIKNLNLLSKEKLGQELDVEWNKNVYQITYHPETLSNTSSEKLFKELLNALDELEDSTLIFTKANADTDGRIINQMIDDYVSKNKDKAKAFSSLGSLRFLSLLSFCDGVIGNSSSGIVEVPTFKIPTINIGNRQKGRIQSTSIINCNTNKEAIVEAINFSKSEGFKNILHASNNPYGEGKTTNKIMETLKKSDFISLKIKSFYNIDTCSNE
ncbi:UDP-N-acetylglucosamine 2-epimerase [Empedobacter falsenii]